MDLAKIRKKSLQAQTQATPDFFQQETRLSERIALSVEPVEEKPAVCELDLFENLPLPVVVPASPVAAHADTRSVVSDPLEIILAGRTASGCDNEASLAEEDVSQAVVEDYLEFLIFRVSDEIYGINIMDIKEIIKPREVTEVPRAPAFVTGILSLRGTIISIIDMRLRLGLIREQITGKERVVVIKNAESFSGLLVDEVIQVVRILKEAVEPAPAVLEGIDRDFVFGIGRSDGRLIIILNLANIADIHLY